MEVGGRVVAAELIPRSRKWSWKISGALSISTTTGQAYQPGSYLSAFAFSWSRLRALVHHPGQIGSCAAHVSDAPARVALRKCVYLFAMRQPIVAPDFSQAHAALKGGATVIAFS